MKIIDGEEDIARGVAALREQCPHIARAITVTGLPPLRRGEVGFRGLARIIVFQQISIAAGGSIWARTQAALPDFTPQALLCLTDADLKAAGLSAPKIRTLRAVADAVVAGDVDFDALPDLPAEDISARLTAIKGIGPWTADIYMLFALGHADAWPVGDLAVQEAVKMVLDLDSRPDAKAMVVHGERWRPYRAVAARVLWAYYGVVRNLKAATPV